MGNLCDSCTKLQPSATTAGESRPLVSHDDRDVQVRGPGGDGAEARGGAKYYQSVIDEAHRNFISSSSRRRMGMGSSEADELRAKVTNASVDASSALGSHALTRPKGSTKNNNGTVLEILSEPVDIAAIDAVADEIAELVSSHTFNFRMEDTFSSTVVSFKPVVGTLSL
jgi:hypothetical protein